jgi:hypothetical protein
MTLMMVATRIAVPPETTLASLFRGKGVLIKAY